jgi:hypothetical protein
MGKILDMNGNIINDGYTLLERARLAGKRESENLDRMMNLVHLNNEALCFLYNFPHDDEYVVDERPNWETYVDVINNQRGLGPEQIENARIIRSDLEKGEKVIVVYGERPFCDSLPLGRLEKNGNASGWVGRVNSFDLTNINESNFLSLDGKVYARIKLTDARELTHDKVEAWALNNIMYFHHRFREPLDSFFDKIRSSSKDTEEFLIYQPFFNLDYCRIPNK